MTPWEIHVGASVTIFWTSVKICELVERLTHAEASFLPGLVILGTIQPGAIFS